MTSRIGGMLWLALVWIALWEVVTPTVAVGGVVVGVLLFAAFPSDAGRPRLGAFRPLAVLRFLGFFAVKVVEANAAIALAVLTPGTRRVNEGIVEVPVTGASEMTIALLASAISLTPGTLVMEVRQDAAVMYIHALQLRSPDALRVELHDLELRIALAFASEEGIAAVRTRIAQLEAAMAATDGPAAGSTT